MLQSLFLQLTFGAVFVLLTCLLYQFPVSFTFGQGFTYTFLPKNADPLTIFPVLKCRGNVDFVSYM